MKSIKGIKLAMARFHCLISPFHPFPSCFLIKTLSFLRSCYLVEHLGVFYFFPPWSRSCLRPPCTCTQFLLCTKVPSWGGKSLVETDFTTCPQSCERQCLSSEEEKEGGWKEPCAHQSLNSGATSAKDESQLFSNSYGLPVV